MGKISPSGILLGVLAAQASAYVFGFVIGMFCLGIFGNRVLVEFMENPVVIAVTLFAGLISAGIGGYASLLAPGKSMLNAVLAGIFTLIISLLLLWFIDFKYATGHRWILILSWILTVPCAYLGGRLYMMKYNSRQETA